MRWLLDHTAAASKPAREQDHLERSPLHSGSCRWEVHCTAQFPAPPLYEPRLLPGPAKSHTTDMTEEDRWQLPREAKTMAVDSAAVVLVVAVWGPMASEPRHAVRALPAIPGDR